MFILIKMMREINNRLKSNLNRINPNLETDTYWFFSNTKKKVLDYSIMIITLIWLLMILTNKVPSFLYLAQ